MHLPDEQANITIENGFLPTKALDIKRYYMLGKDYIKLFGEYIQSLEGLQNVTEDSVVMFDNHEKLMGYPASEKAFSKYEIISESTETEFGYAVKKDPTVYLSKKMSEIFSAVIWNNDVVTGNIGDYLVANVDNQDFRVVAAEMFPKSYQLVD